MTTKDQENQKGQIPSDGSDTTHSHIPFWTGEGYCFGGGDISSADRFRITQLEFNLPKQNEGSTQSKDTEVAKMGKLVTKKAANVMIRDYLDDFEKLIRSFPEDKRKEAFREICDKVPIRVTFGKEALLFLLGQSGCEGITFYYCKGPSTKPSLVLVGVGKDGKALGAGGDGTIIDREIINPKNPTSPECDPSIAKAERQKTAIVEVGGTDGPGGKGLFDILTLCDFYDKYLPNKKNKGK
jgi:hypothetical protein